MLMVHGPRTVYIFRNAAGPTCFLVLYTVPKLFSNRNIESLVRPLANQLGNEIYVVVAFCLIRSANGHACHC